MVVVGIPEALKAVQLVLEIAIKLANEGGHLARIAKGIKKTKKFLAAIDSRMKDKKHPLYQANGDMKSALEEDCIDIKTGCHEARKMLKNRERMSPINPARIIFVISSIPELYDILAGFKDSRDAIDRTINVIMTDTEAQNAAKASRDQSAKEKEKQKLSRQIEELKKAQKEEKKAREKARKEREKDTAMIVNLLKELGKDKVQEVAMGKDDVGKKSVTGWVDELEKKGVAKKDARESIEKTLSAVRSESKSQHKSLTKAAKDETKKGERSEKAYQAEREKAGNTTKKGTGDTSQVPVDSHTPATTKSQNGRNVAHETKLEGGNKGGAGKGDSKNEITAEQKHIWILCVDSTNGARSTMAQTYLELVRVWTMNTQKRWLFERVHSVGIRIPTDLTKETLEADKLEKAKAKKVVKAAPITVLGGDESYFKTKTPNEKETILSRIREHSTSGLDDYHFETFEYILCFDKETKILLEKMKKLAEVSLKAKNAQVVLKSNIHQLDCGSLDNDDEESVDKLQRTAGKMKVAIKDFLKANLKWEKPAIAIAEGEWRTLQVLVSEETKKKVKESDKLKEVSKKKGIKIMVGRDTHGRFLVSISGPVAKLEDAVTALKRD